MSVIQKQYGNPANYNATAPTLTDGSPSALAVDVNQNLLTSAGTGLNKNDDIVTAYPQGTTYTQLSASATVVSGPGQLKGIFCSSASSTPTITVYDNIAGSGPKMVDTFTPSAGTYYNLADAIFNTGCYVTISGTVSCTVFTE